MGGQKTPRRSSPTPPIAILSARSNRRIENRDFVHYIEENAKAKIFTVRIRSVYYSVFIAQDNIAKKDNTLHGVFTHVISRDRIQWETTDNLR